MKRRLCRVQGSGKRVPCTKALAKSAAADAANRQMRAAGRSRWSAADYNLAVRVFDRLWTEE